MERDSEFLLGAKLESQLCARFVSLRGHSLGIRLPTELFLSLQQYQRSKATCTSLSRKEKEEEEEVTQLPHKPWLLSDL